MAIGTTLFVIAILIIAIWAIFEFKRFRHKLLAIILISLILFTYFSFTAVLKRNDVSINTVQGMMEASKLYFAWLGSVFVNIKSITVNAINMDWKTTNQTAKT